MDELLKERYDLAKDRIVEICTETTVKPDFLDFFQNMAAFLEKTAAILERDEEKLSIEEFYAKYGTPVVTTNLYDADGFIGLLSEINSFIQNGNLKSELQYLMDQTEQAKETHRMEIVNDIYKKLHDLDYFLLRYGPKDVAKYVEDDSTVSKYYGTLPFYQ